jgi:Ribosomal protein S8E
MTKKSGGRIRPYRKTRKYDLGDEFSEPELGEQRIETKDSRGTESKTAVRRENQVNVPVDGEVDSLDIESVEDNPANDNFVRRSLLTKGTVVDTSEGEVRITSRPGQEGVVNGVLIE